MNRQLITSIDWLRRGACVTAVLLLLCFMLPLTVQAASPQDPRIAAINADVAAGTDIAVIIQNAVAAGLTVQQAVEAIVAAGVDPGRVVYLAILANYPATDVITGAANAVSKMGLSETAFQAQITLIVSTARQAGATAGQVNSGLSLTGVSPNIIANANALAARNPAPVFGYTAPTPPAPPMTAGFGGPSGTPIGGSGIGAPPTKAASQTNPK